MMTALLQQPDQVAESREWYNSRLDGLDLTSTRARNARLAFLASEGVFFLKSFNLIDLDGEAWEEVFEAILALAKSGRVEK